VGGGSRGIPTSWYYSKSYDTIVRLIQILLKYYSGTVEQLRKESLSTTTI
jgi:hypothetical protein